MAKHLAGNEADVSVCMKELEDFDCVIKATTKDGRTAFKPVQLKQLPDHKSNPDIEVQTLINHVQSQRAASP